MAARILVRELQAFGAALQLLTRIPIPAAIPFTSQVLARSTVYYPVVGLMIGLISAAAGMLLMHLFPPLVAAVFALIIWVALSGALHLDGLMDTADGVLSHRSRERMLEIMKDSRVGAMGVIAAVLLLLLKFVLLYELLGEYARGTVYIWLVAACIWSRTWMVAAIAIWPSARGNEGMGALLAGTGKKHLSAAVCIAALLTFALLYLSDFPPGSSLLFLFCSMCAAGIAGGGIAWQLNRKLGGLTGDTYGAMNEMVECVLLAAALGWLHCDYIVW
ncbi:adenosylcobinamide-GDP ribazoletransferase [Paenibacillus sp. GCM10027626]|uniref:adenosylcobinamide-GDP ribazoletransferase n=1 Tax=Paenibacillus sp. GCM10027626 TaxID=3273411 RepID=UPI00362A4E6F